ncbi:S-layer homology domain-containing protein [Gottschalkia purinilytica]|uniref:S-layer homology domain-containing protein n=1 Tax=Gottschalkia purinilytica TaxID=1503 RepID=UPI00067D9F52|nr:S-layer homology domain-containing protein [Gottschalkia purinilytica]
MNITKNKVLSLVLFIVIILNSSLVFAITFQDVPQNHWAIDHIEKMTKLGIITGYEDGTFRPDKTITRAEFAVLAVNIKGLEEAAKLAKGKTEFSDVPDNNWASGYINIASKNGFIYGVGNGKFEPNSPIRYEQAIALVMRILGYEEKVKARGGYPYGYLIVAGEEGVLNNANGVYGDLTTRGVATLLLDNALEVEIMERVVYGNKIVWEKIGKRLYNELGLSKINKERVKSYNKEKNTITVGSKTLEVKEGFNFEEVYGLKTTIWYKYDKSKNKNYLVDYKVEEKAKFDAVQLGKIRDIILVTEDKEYNIAEDAELRLNGSMSKLW